MQFTSNGPEIPDALLEAHEEGRVVFFCGAGISYPADLPGFEGLVDRIYAGIGTAPNPIEKQAYSRGQFDAALDLLERRVPGNRLAVRRALANSLVPNLKLKGATATHDALLDLASTRDGSLRLVTTNFDHIFERVARRKKLKFTSYSAPLLPIPKNSRWSGIVYLHGILPATVDDEQGLQRLVVTSGDFGLAYLTERWASRFVSDLFKNYIVCFVGYSINDPVLRYMMDAIAADKMLGEQAPQAYAFGDYSGGNRDIKAIDWEAKGVTPILYEVPIGTHDHSIFHDTLRIWARTYSGGTLGKERIVIDYALTKPSGSTAQDDFVGRMLWALSDNTGLPAKRFAEFDPAPALAWIDPLCERKFSHIDLSRFGVVPQSTNDPKLKFSLTSRPAPYSLAPWMTLTLGHPAAVGWDEVMHQLARWLLRHLDDPNLILWLSNQGGVLHSRFARLLESQLDKLADLEKAGDIKELSSITANAPNAIPRPLMRAFWRLYLTDAIKVPWLELDLYQWKDRLKRDGLTTTTRREFRRVLSPKIAIRKPFRWPKGEEDEAQENTKPLDWELTLAADHAHSAIKDVENLGNWGEYLPALFNDIEQLLREALDLSAELGGAEYFEDMSSWHLPSIAPHWQNRGYQDWVALVELLRDAWERIKGENPSRAREICLSWFDGPYPTFKRLALYAAANSDLVTCSEWLDWLSRDDHWWLWSMHTKREIMRLIVQRSNELTPRETARLAKLMLAGPPRDMYKDSLSVDDWRDIVDREVWLRLAKLRSARGALTGGSAKRYDRLSQKYPAWRLADNDRDEFWHWMSGTGDPDFETRREVDVAPNRRSELTKWLRRTDVKRNPYYEDTWSLLCESRFYLTFVALCDLAREGEWPTERWRDALQAWSRPPNQQRSWSFVSSALLGMPDSTFSDLGRPIAWWLDALAKGDRTNENLFVELASKVLDISWDQEDESSSEPLTQALNHPVGLVTQGLLSVWFSRKPNDNDRIPENLLSLFTRICDSELSAFRHGRTMLASQAIALQRVDPDWTLAHLLPRFSWQTNPIEARHAWNGFLWSPRLHWPLLNRLKSDFLATAEHYEELGQAGRQYAAIMTFAALEPSEEYASSDFQTAMSHLPLEGLQEVAQTLAQAQEGAADRATQYWTQTVRPFWLNVWPKSRDLASPRMAEIIARMVIATDEAFPTAFDLVADWLEPIDHPHYVLSRLDSTNIPERFPQKTVELLSCIIIENYPWPPRELRPILTRAINSQPQIASSPKVVVLDNYLRQHDL